MANASLHGVDLVIGKDGQASLVPNNEVGPASPQESAFADVLNSSISRLATVAIGVTSGQSDIIFGQFVTNRIDIGDIAAVGGGAGVTSAAVLAHEIREQEVKQTFHFPNTKERHQVVHPLGIKAQESVSGYNKISTTDSLNAENTGNVVGMHQRNGVTTTVTFQFVHGNLVRVIRR